MAIKCQSRDGGVLYIRFYTHARSLALPLFKLKGLEQININTRGWSSLIMSRRKSSKPKGFLFFYFFYFTQQEIKHLEHENYVFTSDTFLWFDFTHISYYLLFILLYIYIFLPPFFPCFSMFSIHYPPSLSLFVSMAQTVLLSLSGAVRKWPRNRLLIQLSSLATRQGPPG